MLFLYLLTAGLGTILLSFAGVTGLLMPYFPAEKAFFGIYLPNNQPLDIRTAHFTIGFFAVLTLTFSYIYTLFWIEGTSRGLLGELEEKKKQEPYKKLLLEARHKVQPLAVFSLVIVVMGLLSGGAAKNKLPTWSHYVMVSLAYLQNLYGLTQVGDRLIDHILFLEETEKKAFRKRK